MQRLSSDFLYMEVARLFAQRGTCPRAQVGAVIVQDNRVISTGYNGAPPGMDHCGGRMELCGPDGCTNAVHAEANAVAWAARNGIPVNGATMYCTHAPCNACAQLMLSAGIKEVYFNYRYRDESGVKLLEEAEIAVVPVDE